MTTTSITAPVAPPSPTTTHASSSVSSSRGVAQSILSGAAKLWLVTMIVSQWSFVYYIVAFYAVTTFQGNFQAWTRNTMLTSGYKPGDTVGNLVFASHALLAGVIAVGGTLQLIPSIRRRFIAVHRWNGRLFLIAAIAASVGGLYMTWIRSRQGSILSALAITINALLIGVFVALAWRAARAGEIARHRRWAMRAFIVVNGVWFIRVGFAAWLIVQQGPVAMTTFYRIWQFLSYLLPLAVLELYLRANDGHRSREKVAMAGALVMLTILTAVGAVGLYVAFLRPILLKV
jgi:hypothetical protein